MSKQVEWEDGATESTLTSGPWFARATGFDWAVYLDGVGKIRGGMRAGRAANKSAALAAFAELRVSLDSEP